jgi:hypothetical protein
MTPKSRMVRLLVLVLLVGGGLTVSSSIVAAQTGESLGTVRLPRSVMANGQPLAAGTYAARLSTETASPVVGQPVDSTRWVEFVTDGQVRGRELATVVAPADVKQVAKGTPPAQGTARVQTLRGGEYLRVWLNRAGTQYLIHLSVK